MDIVNVRVIPASIKVLISNTNDLMSSALNIGLVGPLPPPSGGMANQTLQLSKLLSEENISVEIVQTNSPYKPNWIRKFPIIRAVFRLMFYLVRLWRVAGRVNLFHIMANSGWSWHLFTVPAVWIGKMRGIPTVINYRGGEADNFFNQSFKYVRPTLNASSSVVVPSSFLEEVFRKYGVSPQIIANIIDLDRFKHAKSSSKVKSPHLLVARNLEKIYDNETAINAFSIIKKKFPQASLTIAGTGPELENLKRLTHQLKLTDDINFSGRVDTSDMPALYQSADIMLNPSRVDNMPNSILEALASGVPVVSTNVGGIPYMVEDQSTALLVPPESPKLMADAIYRVLEDKLLKQSLINSGLELVQQFSWVNVRQHWLTLYRELSAG